MPLVASVTSMEMDTWISLSVSRSLEWSFPMVCSECLLWASLLTWGTARWGDSRRHWFDVSQLCDELVQSVDSTFLSRTALVRRSPEVVSVLSLDSCSVLSKRASGTDSLPANLFCLHIWMDSLLDAWSLSRLKFWTVFFLSKAIVFCHLSVFINPILSTHTCLSSDNCTCNEYFFEVCFVLLIVKCFWSFGSSSI